MDISKPRQLTAVTALLFLLFMSSCATRKPVPYFADFPDTARLTILKTVPFKNPVIQPNDILLITIATLDINLVSPVNTTNSINSGAQPANGYMVNTNGFVELPFVGSIKVSGLSTMEAQDTIKAAANRLFNNPIVSVRYANFKVTVLGEVNTPGSFVMTNEKVTLFDALGMAGDLTLTAKTNSLLLVRDSTGDNKELVRLNINSKDIIHSPYYFLRPNDMIYVEPTADRLLNTAEVSANRQRVSLIVGAIGALTSIIVLITRF